MTAFCHVILIGSKSYCYIILVVFGVEAMGKLSYLLYPICLSGAAYSLIYTPHRR